MKIKLILFSLVLSACGRFANTEEAGPVKKERIVCISKQYTEIIFALGAEQDLVGVDVSSTYPEEAKKIKTVGYHRALSAEGILALDPTLILHDNNIGPDHVVKQLEDLKISMKAFSDGGTIDSVKILIREMGSYFHKEKAADSLCAKLDSDMQNALSQIDSTQKPTRVLVIHYGQASNVYLIMTRKSTAAKLIEWAGGEMSVEDVKGMKQLSAEAVAESDPDVILLTDFGYDKLGSNENILGLPGVAQTRAAKNGNIFRIEEHDLVYLGPRTGENVLKIRKLIHPD